VEVPTASSSSDEGPRMSKRKMKPPATKITQLGVSQESSRSPSKEEVVTKKKNLEQGRFNKRISKHRHPLGRQ
jgi:hypothetical protein